MLAAPMWAAKFAMVKSPNSPSTAGTKHKHPIEPEGPEAPQQARGTTTGALLPSE